jgi:hypothetical protein
MEMRTDRTKESSVTTTTEKDAAFGLPAPSSLLTRTLEKKQIEIQFSSVLTFGNGNEWFFSFPFIRNSE